MIFLVKLVKMYPDYLSAFAPGQGNFFSLASACLGQLMDSTAVSCFASDLSDLSNKTVTGLLLKRHSFQVMLVYYQIMLNLHSWLC